METPTGITLAALEVEMPADDNDHAFRIIAIGDAVLSEASENPAIAIWLDSVIEQRVTNADERALFGLPPLPSGEVVSFPRPSGENDG